MLAGGADAARNRVVAEVFGLEERVRRYEDWARVVDSEEEFREDYSEFGGLGADYVQKVLEGIVDDFDF